MAETLLMIFFFLFFPKSQTVQQNIHGQWQLWHDVLRSRIQLVHRETDRTVPLQISLVLLCHLQEVRKDGGEICLQISTMIWLIFPKAICFLFFLFFLFFFIAQPNRLLITQSTTEPRGLTFDLSFSFTQGTHLLFYIGIIILFFKLPVGLISLVTNLDVEHCWHFLWTALSSWTFYLFVNKWICLP